VTVDAVRRYYNSKVAAEWGRLDRHPVEFAITKRILSRWIDKPRSRILDVGAGPGRYSLWLASLGHELTLVDLAEENVAFAREKARSEGIEIKGFHAADARRLSSLGLGSFDYVLLMGPMYHVLEEEERAAAAREALARLEPGGLIFVSFISAYAPLIDALAKDPSWILQRKADFLGYLEDGRNVEAERGVGFTDAYFAKPGEIRPFMASFGLEELGLYNAESVLFPYERILVERGAETLEACVEVAMRFVEDEAIRGMSAHYLYAGRKPR
jgi:S-adenosylmethionine-dependent methyltransferase